MAASPEHSFEAAVGLLRALVALSNKIRSTSPAPGVLTSHPPIPRAQKGGHAWEATCFGKGMPWIGTHGQSCPPLQAAHTMDLGGKATSTASAAGGSTGIRLPALLPTALPIPWQLGGEKHPVAQCEGKAFDAVCKRSHRGVHCLSPANLIQCELSRLQSPLHQNCPGLQSPPQTSPAKSSEQTAISCNEGF